MNSNESQHHSEPEDPMNQNGKVFVLVHGGAQGAWAFEKLAWPLTRDGHQVVARDLPGHGLRAREAIPQLIHRLVYISAVMPAPGKSFFDYTAIPEAAASKVPAILVGNPQTTGALRIDFQSTDPGYQAEVKAALAADVDDNEWQAVTNQVSPDIPTGWVAEPVAITADRWGAIPRTYISCTADFVFPAAQQRLFIDEADKLTPSNPTDVREIATSHSPFLSEPDQLARIVLQL